MSLPGGPIEGPGATREPAAGRCICGHIDVVHTKRDERMEQAFPGQTWNGCQLCGCFFFRPEDEISIWLQNGSPWMAPDPAEELAQLRARLVEVERAKGAAYTERNLCVALIARMARSLGWWAGIGKHEDKPGEAWDADWRTLVCVDLPTGQVSWHFHESHREMLHDLPPYPLPWDGHDTPEKYRRVRAALALSGLPPLASAIEYCECSDPRCILGHAPEATAPAALVPKEEAATPGMCGVCERPLGTPDDFLPDQPVEFRDSAFCWIQYRGGVHVPRAPQHKEEAARPECLDCGMGQRFHYGSAQTCPGLRKSTIWRPPAAPAAGEHKEEGGDG